MYKNKIKHIALIILAIIGMSYFGISLAEYSTIPGSKSIQSSSIKGISASGDVVNDINNIGFGILSVAKLIIQGILIIFIVYIGAQMIWSMGDDEETLSKAKRQIRYSVIAMLFINIPGSIYNSIHRENYTKVGNRVSKSEFLGNSGESNMFFDVFNFGYTFGDQIVGFLEVIILAVAIVVIIYEGLKMISSRGREEIITEAKNKVIYSILALIFVGIIEAWKSFAFSFKVKEATNIFGNLADLALFFAAPIAFFFLTIAGYYYITSAGDDERIKKAKSIVINTILATLILLAAYTFLLDLANL